MIDRGLEAVFGKRRERRTTEFLERAGISVEFINPPEGPCLVAATHPTTWDSVVWRRLPKTFHAVHADALRKSGVSEIDRLAALHVSRMIPVHKGSPEKRQQTYKDIANKLDEGNIVVINPTGATSRKNEIPKLEEVKIGGIAGSLRLSNIRRIVPSVVWVEGRIEEDGTIAKGSRVKVCFGEDLDIKDLGIGEQTVNKEEFARRLVGAWEKIVADNNLSASSSP